MELYDIQSEIIDRIGRETIDKFVEDEKGNLAYIETISITGIVRQVYEMATEGKDHRIQVLEKALELAIGTLRWEHSISEIKSIFGYVELSAIKENKTKSFFIEQAEKEINNG